MTDTPSHPFDPGFTGMSIECNQLMTDAEGAGVECGLPREAHREPKIEGLRKQYNVAIANGKVMEARKIGRRIDALQNRGNG